ncbi:MAG: hypothetical protein QMC81_03900 [Thermoanaerobacterales bacterium]|nr:hypothetical protein [Thermoanaerobacterales bacterium]
MQTRSLSTFSIAATYIGTVVGAGFASGQEVLQFFSFFGPASFPALALAALLFVFFGRIILQLGHRLRARSHLEVIRYAGGPWLGAAVDGIITFFLFGALTAMAAGGGAIFAEQFGLPPALGSALIVGASLATVLLGLRGVITAISFVAPVLLVAVIGVSLVTVYTTPPDPWAIRVWASPASAAVPSWPLAALTYASYNLVLAVAVLAPLGAGARDEAALRRGALWGGIGLGLGALFINLAILSRLEAAGFEVPMAFVAGEFTRPVQVAYIGVLLAEIYTTAVGNLYGFGARLADPATPKFHWVALLTAGAALAAGQLGFSTLVRYLYSAVGLAGFLMLGGLFYRWARERLRVPQPTP